MSALAFTPLLLQTVLLWALIRRRGYKAFPWFFAYTLFSVIATTGRFLVRSVSWLYFELYWSTEAIYAILGIAVLYEVFRAVFLNLRHMWWLRLIFPAAVVFSIALTIARAHVVPPQIQGRLMAWIILGELAVRLLQVLIFVLLVALVALLGLHWRQYAFGISAGFGIYATVVLLTTTTLSEFGTKFGFLWGWSVVVAYSIAVLIWLWYFSTPEKPEPPRPENPPLSLEELRRYKELIRRIRQQ